MRPRRPSDDRYHRSTTPLSRQFRDVFEPRDLTGHTLGKVAEGDLRLATADRIALALGLRLVEVAQSKGRERAAKRLPGGSPAEDSS